MTQFFYLYGAAIGAILLCLVVLWAISVYIRDASIIDIFWGPGFIVCNWVTLALADGDITARQWLVHGMVTIWGARLAMHLFVRNAGSGEDARYQRWRENAGPSWWYLSFHRVYLFQGLIMMVVALPVIVVNVSPEQVALGWLDLIGIGVWLLGFGFEAVSDQQLVTFKRKPANAGKVMNTGLWRYSLHPNYFGDALQWWGLWIVVISVPNGWLTVIGPVVMTAIFLGISNGVLERSLKRSKPEYEHHVARTSAFFPKPPRSEAGSGV